MTALVNRIVRAVRNPARAAAALRSRLSAAAMRPLEGTTHPQMRALATLSRALGIGDLHLVMSFDCDTPEDAVATRSMQRWLTHLRIKATYAVPGAQLAEAAEDYRSIASLGAMFINHGERPHAEKQGSRYVGITDYASMSAEEVVADISGGDRIFRRVFGHAPEGFRAPHFGSYCRPEQLEVLYGCARRLGYRFCSTTLPALAYAEGPAVRREGLWEFPLSGSLGHPNVILDSWNYLSDRENYVLKEEYFQLFRDTLDFFLAEGLPAVLNYYVDPAHVIDNPPFHHAMEYAAARGVRSVFFHELMALVERGTGG